MKSIVTQIYAAISVADALKMVELGVDQVGFIAGDYGEVHAELTFAQAREIVEAVRGQATTSALTMSTDINEILRMVEAVRPDIVHISSDTEAMSVPATRRLRELLPPEVALMKAIHVAGPESIKAAQAFAAVSQFLLLDTKVRGMPGVGATGVTHDWSISREIVRRIGPRAKVILAGGLVPDNLAEAIRTVRPWGVDSNTGTNLPGDPVTKDWAKVAAFVAEARRATNEE